MFFVIAGMLAVKWMRRPLRDVIRSKVATLAWLYVLWQLVTVLAYLVIPNVSTPGKGNLRELLTAAATVILPQNSLWFIWALALFFIISHVLYERVPVWAVILPAAAVSSLSLAGMIPVGNIGWNGALSNFVFFAAGVYGVKLLTAFAGWLNVWTALAVVSGWVVCLMFLPTLDAVGLNLLTRGLGLAAGISLGVLLQRLRGLGRVGAQTLIYYLPHYVILGALAFVASEFSLPATTALWLPAALLILTVLLCVGLRRIIQLLRCEDWAYGLPSQISRRIATKDQVDSSV
ncbi:fucose 4-O-acetylase-like acetyltransferase [Pseudarthrobacter sulfonivorans]|nr:fucose 4-O-acetylase-like acetyltransferase [Pseudarthrobacter sulfonivorans]